MSSSVCPCTLLELHVGSPRQQPTGAISAHVMALTHKPSFGTEGKNQTLVGAIPFCGEYPGPRFEDKFRSANQIDGISIATEVKWLTVNL